MDLQGGKRRRRRRTTSGKKKKPVRASTEKRHVFSGKKASTRSGLKKSNLTRNKAGKIVSKKKSAAGKRNPWIKAVSAARRQLGITGFYPVRKGSELYELAMSIKGGR